MQPAALSKLLGHSKVSITMNVYVHALESQQARLAPIMEGVLYGG